MPARSSKSQRADPPHSFHPPPTALVGMFLCRPGGSRHQLHTRTWLTPPVVLAQKLSIFNIPPHFTKILDEDPQTRVANGQVILFIYLFLCPVSTWCVLFSLFEPGIVDWSRYLAVTLVNFPAKFSAIVASVTRQRGGCGCLYLKRTLGRSGCLRPSQTAST